MNIKFDNYIVMTPNEYRGLGNISSQKNYRFTINGFVVVPMDKPVPIIIQNQGCVGLAKVSSINMSNDETTTMEFSINTVSKSVADAAYILYKNEAVIRSSDDDSDERSAPGIYKSKMTNRNPFNIMDDEDDEDDDFHPYHPKKY